MLSLFKITPLTGIWSLVMVFFYIEAETNEIYTLSLHDALPIFSGVQKGEPTVRVEEDRLSRHLPPLDGRRGNGRRSEEHTSELQSLAYLVCRLLLEKKKTALSRSTASTGLPVSTAAALA